MLTSLGKDPSDELIDSMVGDAPGPLNFTMFLTMLGEQLNGTDPHDVISNAFSCFDELNTGKVPFTKFMYFKSYFKIGNGESFWTELLKVLSRSYTGSTVKKHLRALYAYYSKFNVIFTDQ